jgi:membrane protein
LILGGAGLVFFGDFLLSLAFGYVRLSGFENNAAALIRYLIGFIMLYGGLTVIYNFGPNTLLKPSFLNPGSIFATIACLIVSFLFSLYLRIVPTMNATYGSLGAFIVLMLWLYLISAVIMIGAEINSEIEKRKGKKQVAKE